MASVSAEARSVLVGDTGTYTVGPSFHFGTGRSRWEGHRTSVVLPGLTLLPQLSAPLPTLGFVPYY